MSDYMTSHQYATALKQLSEEILSCPDFQLGWSDTDCTLGILANKAELLAFAKNLRPLKKEYDDNKIRLVFGTGRITASITAERTVACRIVEPAKPPVYECDPLLAPEEEAAL